jgi:hypothetical protein
VVIFYLGLAFTRRGGIGEGERWTTIADGPGKCSTHATDGEARRGSGERRIEGTAGLDRRAGRGWGKRGEAWASSGEGRSRGSAVQFIEEEEEGKRLQGRGEVGCGSIKANNGGFINGSESGGKRKVERLDSFRLGGRREGADRVEHGHGQSARLGRGLARPRTRPGARAARGRRRAYGWAPPGGERKKGPVVGRLNRSARVWLFFCFFHIF